MGEFEVIRQFFQRPLQRSDVVLGSGDDCALLRVPADQLLAVSTDTLVSGVHFFADVDPVTLGHKALAVNLSDLAAMGAEPRWASLALTLPEIDEAWLAGFAKGFLQLADAHGVELVGGDMTRGPLAITVSIKGVVPEEGALRRRGAKPGDQIWVTGELGGAALALAHRLQGIAVAQADYPSLLARLELPQPRVAMGMALRGIASSCLDLSDGLASDLGHILRASGVGADIELTRLPLPDALQRHPEALRWQLALAGGDDYELCFTAAPEHQASLEALASRAGLSLSPIGRIVAAEPGIVWRYAGRPCPLLLQGWDHFKES